jgi:hypothetical protein
MLGMPSECKYNLLLPVNTLEEFVSTNQKRKNKKKE